MGLKGTVYFMHYLVTGYLLIGLLTLSSCAYDDDRDITVDEIEIQIMNDSGFGTQEIFLKGRVVNNSSAGMAKIIAICMLQDSLSNTISEEYLYPVNSDFGNVLAAGDSAVFQYYLRDHSLNTRKISLNVIQLLPQKRVSLMLKIKKAIKRIIY
jgi:hypothetical protein